MPPPLPPDSQDSHRAKLRIGVAAALLLTAIAILALLHQRGNGKTVAEPATPAPIATQSSLSSQEAEVPAPTPAPGELPSALPSAQDAPNEPPPPPVPGSLPTVKSVQKSSAGSSIAETTGGDSVGIFKPNAASSLARPAMSAATVDSPAKAASSTSSTQMPKAFEVQLGVFTDMDNAKQLQSRLSEHGIPSHTETRVQIGPFKTREEADKAREKLKALGIAAVVTGKN